MPTLGYRRPAIVGKIRHDRHGVIEANAGTGKTYAIEYLVLDLVLRTECSLEEILVVTFTEKATVELRSRIRTLIEEVLWKAAAEEDRRAPDFVAIDDAGRRKLEAALFAFDRAAICTIHAFCRRVLTDFAFDARAAFGLEVVDARRVFHRAFRSILREVLAVEASTRELLDQWMSGGETAGHPNLVDSLEALLRDAHFNRYLESGACERNQRAIGELVEIFDLPLLKKICSRKRGKNAPATHTAAGALAEILRRHRDSHEQLREALYRFDFEPLAELAPEEKIPREMRLVEAVIAARAASSLETRVVDVFLPLVEQRLRADKRKNGELDYGDMLENVWEALEGPHGDALAGLLRERFRYGLVDEFQDTDDLQWKIFRRIFLEGGRGNILYVVGDPKQAIYSFRGADVFTYLEAQRAILASDGVSLQLTDNYRSTPDLIAALNRILDQNAPSPLLKGSINYSHPVTCGRPDLRLPPPDGESGAPVTLFRYCPARPKAGVARMRASIGRRIAAEIRRILFHPGSELTIKDDHRSRRVEAKDIYILTRTGAEAAEIGGYLREQGVPFAFYKKDGLFQTSEAFDVLDMLNAIEEPDSKSRSQKAWISPFFAVPYPDLFDCREIPAGHALIERLYDWKALADQERLGMLFDQLLHRSGLVSRELFLANNERELTNYLHIFEILLEQIQRERLSLGQVIRRLESFITESALPAGIESNLQRIESERSAVQIMSVHMSKGLQADVVFLFGGSVRSNILPRVYAYHDEQKQRRIVVGKKGRDLGRAALDREAEEENQRLLYVAITRARAKVYLPFYPDNSTRMRPNGYYTSLNDRLKTISAEIDIAKAGATLFNQVDVTDLLSDSDPAAAKLVDKIASWSPPPSLLEILNDGRPARFFDALRSRSRGMQTRSYTSLEARTVRQSSANDIEVEEFKYDLDPPVESIDLKGGRRVGIFLHEVIEKLDLATFDEAPDLGSWRQHEAVRRVFNDAMRRHQVSDLRWIERGTEIVYNALTSRIATSEGKLVGPLYRCSNVREMEFVYPIPELAHRLLQSAGDGQWTVERGYLKGFVDFVFEDGGLHYFADWKSDSLPSYDRDAIERHVSEHYDLQARIYSVGIVRLLGIRSKIEYDARFGGLLYLFIRGIRRDGAGDAGVYFRRPSWTEISGYESSLIGSIPEMATT